MTTLLDNWSILGRIVADPRMEGRVTHAVAWWLLQAVDQGTGCADRSTGWLADKAHASASSVITAIQKLEAAGYFKVEHARGRHVFNRYRPLVKHGAEATLSTPKKHGVEEGKTWRAHTKNVVSTHEKRGVDTIHSILDSNLASNHASSTGENARAVGDGDLGSQGEKKAAKGAIPRQAEPDDKSAREMFLAHLNPDHFKFRDNVIDRKALVLSFYKKLKAVAFDDEVILAVAKTLGTEARHKLRYEQLRVTCPGFDRLAKLCAEEKSNLEKHKLWAAEAEIRKQRDEVIAVKSKEFVAHVLPGVLAWGKSFALASQSTRWKSEPLDPAKETERLVEQFKFLYGRKHEPDDIIEAGKRWAEIHQHRPRDQELLKLLNEIAAERKRYVSSAA